MEGSLSEHFALTDCPGRPGRLSASSVPHSKSVLYGVFVWVREVLDRQKRRFSARAMQRPKPGAGCERRSQTAKEAALKKQKAAKKRLVPWEAQLVRLVAHKAKHAEWNVLTKGWVEDSRLGKKFSHQRQLKRKLDHGELSEGLTTERVARLTVLGLVWDPSPKASGAALPNEAKKQKATKKQT